MKKLLLFSFLIAFIQLAVAQSPYTAKTLASKGDVTLAESSAHNVWLGSKITGTFGSGDLSENFLLSGKIIYDLGVGALKIPVVSNVNFDFTGDVTSFVFGDKGISVGLYPYKIISTTDKLTTLIHGGALFKLLPLESFKLSAKQTKLFGGLEFAYKIADNDLPLTLSITPAYIINNIDAINQFVVEATAVMPVSGGLGVLAELTTPTKKGYEAIFKIGVILNGKL